MEGEEGPSQVRGRKMTLRMNLVYGDSKQTAKGEEGRKGQKKRKEERDERG